jgi:saccharopepsin
MQLDSKLRYSFQNISNHHSRVALETIQHMTSAQLADSHDTVIINIPLNPAIPGSVVFSHNRLLDISTVELTWLPTSIQATHIQLDHIGIRRGGMVSMPAWCAWLSLDTPYVFVPDKIFEVLLQATKPFPNQNPEGEMVVDCDSMRIFPNIVFGLDGEDGEEIIVKPEQYIMEIEERKCVLLARSRRNGMMKMGWAAIRGREFVVDRSRVRMGFGN